jgi:hypothetical protein
LVCVFGVEIDKACLCRAVDHICVNEKVDQIEQTDQIAKFEKIGSVTERVKD